LNNPKRIEFALKVNALPDDCKICEWLSACRNGCTSHRIGGIDGKYAYCEGQKKVFSYFKPLLSH
jgi:radical SAM protein with 4Fe4S-binding SPASM domain